MRLAVFMLILLLLCTGWAYALNKEGLVMYLPFDEGNGSVARDASGNGNDGIKRKRDKGSDGWCSPACHPPGFARYYVGQCENGILIDCSYLIRQQYHSCPVCDTQPNNK